MRIISHGAGVQTTALCLMAARGDVGPMPDLAIFSDVGNEPASVYRYLDWLAPQLPFPIIRVSRPGPSLGNLTKSIVSGELKRVGSALPPLYFRKPDGTLGMLQKHCSAEFKREVVNREIRRLMGLKPGQRITQAQRQTVEVWIGMSTDELQRVATSRYPLLHNRHPLVELNMTRQQCIRWLQEHQYPVPSKSSCIFCPYRTGQQWLHMEATAPEDFEEACLFDEAIRPGLPGVEGECYVHRSLIPLRDRPFALAHTDQISLPLGADCDSCGL